MMSRLNNFIVLYCISLKIILRFPKEYRILIHWSWTFILFYYTVFGEVLERRKLSGRDRIKLETLFLDGRWSAVLTPSNADHLTKCSYQWERVDKVPLPVGTGGWSAVFSGNWWMKCSYQWERVDEVQLSVGTGGWSAATSGNGWMKARSTLSYSSL